MSQVANIEIKDSESVVYDLTVPDGHNYISNGLVSHNTITACYLVTKLKLRPLVFANQKDLLKQFESEFRKFTNIEDIEFSKGRPLIGIAKCIEDYSKWPIVLSTYQAFITEKGKKRLEQVKKMFGAVFVDEVHRAAALNFSRTVAKFHAKVKCGLTATPTRKDRKEFVSNAIIGPVVAVAKMETIVPKVYVHLTKIKPKKAYKIWIYCMQFIAKNKKRNELIANQAVKDVLAGHSVIIPITFIHHANTLADLISKKLYKEFDEPNLAVAFHGKSDRDRILKRAKSGKIKVVVGMRAMLVGINVPRWSALYEIMPISNVPNHYQETQRVCTPMDGKKHPIIRHFVDEDIGMACGCFRACYKLYANKVPDIVAIGTKYTWANDKHREIAISMLGKNQQREAQEENDTYTFKPKAKGSGFGATQPGNKTKMAIKSKGRFSS